MTALQHPWSAVPASPVLGQARRTPLGPSFLMRPSSERPDLVAVGFVRGPCDEPVRCEPPDRLQELYTYFELEDELAGEIWCYERRRPIDKVLEEVEQAAAFGLGVDPGA